MSNKESKTNGRPFDDIRDLVDKIPPRDDKVSAKVEAIFETLSGPSVPLGRLQSALIWLAGWQGTTTPVIQRPLVAVFAGSHKVAQDLRDEDVNDLARQRIQNLSEGSAAVRGIALDLNSAFKVYEMGIEYPCENMTEAPSLSERDCAASIAFGMEVVAEGADIIALGASGLGSATGAAAMALALYGGAAEYWAGGEGEIAVRRIEAVRQAVERHRDFAGDPLQILQCYGGRDIAGMVGAILAARHQSIPLILDGFVSCMAAAVLHKLDPATISHCLAGHISSEPAHGALLDRLGLTPLHDLGVGVGDGTGAAFALGTMKSAAQALNTLTQTVV